MRVASFGLNSKFGLYDFWKVIMDLWDGHFWRDCGFRKPSEILVFPNLVQIILKQYFVRGKK